MSDSLYILSISKRSDYNRGIHHGDCPMIQRSCFIAVAAVFLFPMFASAQFGNNAIFEPQVDVVNSGAVLDAQATVSADRKYVTLTMRPSNAQLLALRTFQFQGGGGPGGIVGGVNPVIPGPGGAVLPIPQQPNTPMRVAPGNGGVILLKRGITPLVLKN
jgi:hypothetical protein